MSYAPPHALIVVADVAMIGCDIERVVIEEPTWLLMEQVFSDEELASFLPLNGRRRAFTTAWTLKEAVLKALGTGLASSLKDVCLHFSGQGRIELAKNAESWRAQTLEAGPDHVAMIVWR